MQVPALKSSKGRKMILSGTLISMKPPAGILLSGLIMIWYSELVPEVTEFVTTIRPPIYPVVETYEPSDLPIKSARKPSVNVSTSTSPACCTDTGF